MNDELIDHLIAARNRLTDVRDELIDFRAVDHIDFVLRAVCEPGLRNDVDALLGRPEAQLERVVMVQHVNGAQEVDPAFVPRDAPLCPVCGCGYYLPDENLYMVYHCNCPTPQDIAYMQARCEETERAEEYSGATESPWM